jgi:hypothetical protein
VSDTFTDTYRHSNAYVYTDSNSNGDTDGNSDRYANGCYRELLGSDLYRG